MSATIEDALRNPILAEDAANALEDAARELEDWPSLAASACLALQALTKLGDRLQLIGAPPHMRSEVLRWLKCAASTIDYDMDPEQDIVRLAELLELARINHRVSREGRAA